MVGEGQYAKPSQNSGACESKNCPIYRRQAHGINNLSKLRWGKFWAFLFSEEELICAFQLHSAGWGGGNTRGR